MDIGQRIKELRERLDWTGVFLASKAEIDPAILSAIEVRKSNRSKYFPAIAAALGVTIEALASNMSIEELVAMRDRQTRIVDLLAPADRELLADLYELLPEDQERFRGEIRSLAEKARRYRAQARESVDAQRRPRRKATTES